ncbi:MULTISPECIES: CcoQ/FixQ family Cbb3-type cytochrome c oxidase assembly chaperone [unclassified Methyloversatilis]|jgi:cytochrome c oxidase cbb3-type subunit 4|uniref:cbb3-type cytochrome oxidase subunit 3 n=1 Tax=unclassified Methyloversatilis TaxID=2639971 RepID=UPI00211B9DAB|nr:MULTISPECIES: CcoQ/FixQ family Cbb3-type cytochrome c oxidase assembly chaperone [unclassified Methyloversatilis]MCQ9374238.1 CcoQ/FixQ family Cbb3-type cytochrome c oxidase assembly chaperone [Methyloversatilis sp. XJ19-13]MDP2869413.1 CcoQ/FixQ family Cbb3-type cytochrome c oxidase assembly chaperone [Methyloversatilis sp.]MDP3457616.1 CcoQ/FixQ family Cbb3-type cytochrome c oxidase assembly chaperone [Methyloversatilis sp.]MDP3577297.1 CcoQ/FixQ family Cbb3-type cytochrome c oxidase assem
MDYDINTLRAAVTVAGFACFIVIVIMAWRPGAQRAHQEAAMLPFADDDRVHLDSGETK